MDPTTTPSPQKGEQRERNYNQNPTTLRNTRYYPAPTPQEKKTNRPDEPERRESEPSAAKPAAPRRSAGRRSAHARGAVEKRRMGRWRSPWLRAPVGSPLFGELLLLLLLLPRRLRLMTREGERGDGRVYIYWLG
jgi:hypothetical protein